MNLVKLLILLKKETFGYEDMKELISGDSLLSWLKLNITINLGGNFFEVLSLARAQMPNYTLNVIYRNCGRASEGTSKFFFILSLSSYND